MEKLMKSTRFNTFTYDVVDEINLGQIEKIAEMQLDYSPDEIHIPTTSEMQAMPDSEVALRLHHPSTGFTNKYACHEPGITQLNINLLLSKESSLPDEIVKTAAYYLTRAARNQGVQIPDELVKLSTKQQTNVVDLTSINETEYFKKLAAQKLSECTQWALPQSKKYPLRNSEDIEKAAEYFEKYAEQFETSDRIEYALNTCKQAHNLGVELRGSIAKYAGLNINDFNDDYKAHISMRKGYTNDTDAHGLYDELLEKSAEIGVVTSVRALEGIDKICGLNVHWGTKVADPVLSLCSMQKEAETEIDGQYVSQSQLNGLLQKDISGWVDDYTKQELSGSDGLDVFKSLPEPTREGLLSEIG